MVHYISVVSQIEMVLKLQAENDKIAEKWWCCYGYNNSRVRWWTLSLLNIDKIVTMYGWWVDGGGRQRSFRLFCDDLVHYVGIPELQICRRSEYRIYICHRTNIRTNIRTSLYLWFSSTVEPVFPFPVYFPSCARGEVCHTATLPHCHRCVVIISSPL